MPTLDGSIEFVKVLREQVRSERPDCLSLYGLCRTFRRKDRYKVQTSKEANSAPQLPLRILFENRILEVLVCGFAFVLRRVALEKFPCGPDAYS